MTIVAWLINIRATYSHISDYSTGGVILSILLLIHNPLTAFYNYTLLTMYGSFLIRNMHAVEDSAIGTVFDKARFHKMPCDKSKRFYYNRGSILKNIAEMLSGGGSNWFLRWILPLPYT